MNKGIRVLFIVLTILIFFISYKFECLKLRLVSNPEFIEKNDFSQVVYLRSSKGLCRDCPQGRFLLTTSRTAAPIFLVPRDFTDFDIENFKDVFQINTMVLRIDDQLSAYFNNILACYAKTAQNANILLHFDDKKRVIGITSF